MKQRISCFSISLTCDYKLKKQTKQKTKHVYRTHQLPYNGQKHAFRWWSVDYIPIKQLPNMLGSNVNV